jgi:hypothetical protein
MCEEAEQINWNHTVKSFSLKPKNIFVPVMVAACYHYNKATFFAINEDINKMPARFGDFCVKNKYSIIQELWIKLIKPGTIELLIVIFPVLFMNNWASRTKEKIAFHKNF